MFPAGVGKVYLCAFGTYYSIVSVASFPGSTASVFCNLEKHQHRQVFFQSAENAGPVEPGNEAVVSACTCIWDVRFQHIMYTISAKYGA